MGVQLRFGVASFDQGHDLTLGGRSSTDPLRILHLNTSFRSNEAVQDLTFGIKRNEVFALLGPNGAGKSTTISIIRGDQARGVRDIARDAATIMHAVSLDAYKTRLIAELSGGNRRKLSLGIALMGDPAVLLLDEPSSGMDAASKRVMWRTLSTITADRCLLITTHSMEEADALAGRVGILAGRMLAIGSSADLRRRFGDGYHVHLVHRGAPLTSEKEMAELRSWVEERISGAVVEERSFHGQIRLRVPNDAMPRRARRLRIAGLDEAQGQQQRPQGSVAALFALLEKCKDDLGIEHYSVSQATLDQVFLRIFGQHNIEEEEIREEKKRQA